MIRVIIVEDEILSRIGIQTLLEEQKDVQVAGTFGLAKDALAYLKTNLVDIVITDIEMPEMNGLEFIREIRSQELADGIIILSCYDKFEYAREAISLGTDYYILKQDINEENLMKAICGVKEKISGRTGKRKGQYSLEQIPDDNGIKVVGVIWQEQDHVNEKMVLHLLDGIINRYHMGSLIESYKRSPFIVFQLPASGTERAREQILEGYIEEIQKNILQYTNKPLLMGISREFRDMQGIPLGYQEAEEAAEMKFYYQSISVYYSRDICWSEETPQFMFGTKCFMEESGLDIFEKELAEFLSTCKREQIKVRTARYVLSQAVSVFIYSILKEYLHDMEGIKKWSGRYPFADAVTVSGSSGEMSRKLMGMIRQFKEDLAAFIGEDEFCFVLSYIERNISTGLPLEELAGIVNMSISAFCRKFKERMQMTPVQYINQMRIEKVKEMIKTSACTLSEAAEAAGFSNENYMVRVFKKITGKTITDYRRQNFEPEKQILNEYMEKE